MKQINTSGDRVRYVQMTRDERLQTFKRLKIEHPHLLVAGQALRQVIREPGGASLVYVYGPAGVGKTALRDYVMRAIETEMSFASLDDKHPILTFLARPPLNGSFAWQEFLQSGFLAVKEHLQPQSMVLHANNDEGQTQLDWPKATRSKRKLVEETKGDALRLSLEAAIKRYRPVAVMIDDAQYLGQVNRGRQLKDQVDCIKSLADVTGTMYVIYNLERSGGLLNNLHYVYSVLVSYVLFQRSRARLYIIFVLIGTYELLPLHRLSAQLIGCSVDIHFPGYSSAKEELAQFRSILCTFQQALPFEEETDILLKNWEYCYERSLGCVGNLHRMLVRAVRAALLADEKALREPYLKQHALSEAACCEMMREVYAGEKEFALEAGHIELRQMLGLEPRVIAKRELSSPPGHSALQVKRRQPKHNLTE